MSKSKEWYVTITTQCCAIITVKSKNEPTEDEIRDAYRQSDITWEEEYSPVLDFEFEIESIDEGDDYTE